MKPIKVTLKGKMNSEFIVKNPKKIEFWKAMAEKGKGAFVEISYKEISDKK